MESVIDIDLSSNSEEKPNSNANCDGKPNNTINEEPNTHRKRVTKLPHCLQITEPKSIEIAIPCEIAIPQRAPAYLQNTNQISVPNGNQKSNAGSAASVDQRDRP
jgi:hypothetical protein